MITKIYDEGNLKRLAPEIIKDSIKLKVIEKAIEKHILDNIKYLVFYDRIKTMSERELDVVANELHVDFYDYSMSIEEKRKSCLQSFAIHSIKGTPASIIKVLNIFFKDFELLEWYEYGGVPGRFKIQLNEIIDNNFQELKTRIRDCKKISQHLEKIELNNKKETRKLYINGFETFEIEKEFIGLKQDLEKIINENMGSFKMIEMEVER